MLFFHVCTVFSFIRKDILFYDKLYQIETLNAPIFLKMYKFRVNSETLKTSITVKGKLSVSQILHDSYCTVPR